MNVTVGTNARRRFFNRQALNTFCHIFLFLKRGFMVFVRLTAQGGLSVAGGCRCLTKDGNTSIEKERYIPYPLQA